MVVPWQGLHRLVRQEGELLQRLPKPLQSFGRSAERSSFKVMARGRGFEPHRKGVAGTSRQDSRQLERRLDIPVLSIYKEMSKI